MNPLLLSVLLGLVVISVFLAAAAWAVWVERKLAARMQSRIGPTIVGPFGLLQPIADVLKMLQKEDIVPTAADRTLFNLAPPLFVFFVLSALAVVPLAQGVSVAPIDVGIVYLLAMGSLAVVPQWLSGWASNNKYALLGGMRAVAQAVSFEVPLVLAALVPVILAGSLDLNEIVLYQSKHHWFAIWPTFPGALAFLLYFIASLAESNRIPFDLSEAESELISGISTEYTGMKFGLFFTAEYVHTIISSAAAATLFLGGWDGPFAPGVHWLALKTLVLFLLIYAIRWSLLRFRPDQFMTLCWKWLVPMGVLLVFSAAACVVFGIA